MKAKMPVRRLFLVLIPVFLVACTFFAERAGASNETKRYPYEHVIRITAMLEFDGERIDIDDLIDCRSKYEGPTSRAAQLGFIASRWQFPYETGDGGMIMYSVQANVCGAFADIWADAERQDRFPDAWLPIIRWFDHRDASLAVHGEVYFSETAIRNPNGRLKILDGFRIGYPEQTAELVAQAAQQVIDRDVWLGNPPRVTDANLNFRKLPWYIRIPRDLWSKPPAYLRAPDRPADPEGLRMFLDKLPEGDDLMFIGEMIESDAVNASINDLIVGRWGSFDFHSSFGIPQSGEQLWGLPISEAAWKDAQQNIEKVPFYDDWVPLDYQDGALVLRTDTPGMAYKFKGYGDWIRNTSRPFQFLDRPLEDGSYQGRRALMIFDKKTRDLWVRAF